MTLSLKEGASMQAVLERLGEGVRNRVRLGERVRRITSDEDRTQFVVETEDRNIHCQYVILTVSLGVLKHQADSLFHPPLPQQKLEVIQKFGFGTVAKIFFEFPVEVTSLCEGLTSSGLNLLRAGSSGWRNLSSSPWQEGVMGLYPHRTETNLLVAWLSGPAAAQVTESHLDSSECDF